MAALGERTTPAWRARHDPTWHRLRLALLVLWLGLVLLTVTQSEKVTSLAELEREITAGHVRAVTVTGDGLEPKDTSSVQGVHWRQGGIRRVAEVVVASRPGIPAPTGVGDETPVLVTTDVGDHLTGAHPGLRVTHGEDDAVGPPEVLDWRVPAWVGIGALLTGALTLFVLFRGPQPWRATRWAWFWLIIATAPVGISAFLLLSGPAPLLRAPGVPGRQLTGRWAFALALGLGLAGCLAVVAGA